MNGHNDYLSSEFFFDETLIFLIFINYGYVSVCLYNWFYFHIFYQSYTNYSSLTHTITLSPHRIHVWLIESSLHWLGKVKRPLEYFSKYSFMAVLYIYIIWPIHISWGKIPPLCEHCQCILSCHILVECNHFAQERKDIFGRRDVVESFRFHPTLILLFLKQIEFYYKF